MLERFEFIRHEESADTVKPLTERRPARWPLVVVIGAGILAGLTSSCEETRTSYKSLQPNNTQSALYQATDLDNSLRIYQLESKI